MFVETDYFPPWAFSGKGINLICTRLAKKIAKHNIKFSAIAFVGVSGALVAPVLASRLGKKLVAVRKKREVHSHSSLKVEGYVGAKTYIIVDDIVASGSTCRMIMRRCKGKCVGILTYNYSDTARVNGIPVY